MELFVSQFVNKIDKKGRVSLPSIFRNALPQNSKNEIILYKSLKHNSIEGCSSDRIKDIADRINKLDILHIFNLYISNTITTINKYMIFIPRQNM